MNHAEEETQEKIESNAKVREKVDENSSVELSGSSQESEDEAEEKDTIQYLEERKKRRKRRIRLKPLLVRIEHISLFFFVVNCLIFICGGIFLFVSGVARTSVSEELEILELSSLIIAQLLLSLLFVLTSIVGLVALRTLKKGRLFAYVIGLLCLVMVEVVFFSVRLSSYFPLQERVDNSWVSLSVYHKCLFQSKFNCTGYTLKELPISCEPSEPPPSNTSSALNSTASSPSHSTRKVSPSSKVVLCGKVVFNLVKKNVIVIIIACSFLLGAQAICLLLGGLLLHWEKKLDAVTQHNELLMKELENGLSEELKEFSKSQGT